MASLLVVLTTAYAQEKLELKTLLGAELLRAAGNDISADDYQKLHFNRCEAIEKYMGFSNTPMGRAIDYSCSGRVIGVTLYAGQDLGNHLPEKVASKFEEKMAEQDMTSKVFIKHNHEHGSVMAIFINGESYTSDWVGPMEAFKDIEALAAEARLIYFNNGQISSQQLGDWVRKGIEP